jgi:hypothetical protein
MRSSVHIYIYVYIHIVYILNIWCMNIYIYTNLYMNIYIYAVCTYICIFICMYTLGGLVKPYAEQNINIYKYEFICIWIFMYTYLCLNIHKVGLWRSMRSRIERQKLPYTYDECGFGSFFKDTRTVCTYISCAYIHTHIWFDTYVNIRVTNCVHIYI